MGLKISDCEFRVGDRVVVSEGVKTCSYGYNGPMLDNIGLTYTVLKIELDHRDGIGDRHSREFLIRISDGPGGTAKWAYDEGCFEPMDKVTRVFESANIEDLFS